ncbi:MAG: uncharacterized protein KVP18_001690 [Porospora cf. gigantea A]|uniref:uncharacterized protein n=1 Tax=Porospora cf. gigantea A TaxID=2853593 RepID=UPI003559EC23|nr:MAG: hypothetical protein KVP18_001690 [Porospora cf. gigantea A]
MCDEECTPAEGSMVEMTDIPDEEEEEASEQVQVPIWLPDMPDTASAVFYSEEPLFSVRIHPTMSDVVAVGGQDDCVRIFRVEADPETPFCLEIPDEDVPEHLQPVLRSVKDREHVKNQKLSLLFSLQREESVSTLAWSACGEYLAVGRLDGTTNIIKLSAEGASHLHDLEGPASDVECIRWHPKGPVLLVGVASGEIWMFYAPNGNLMHMIPGHGDVVSGLEFGAGGKTVVSCSLDGSMQCFEVSTQKTLWRIRSLKEQSRKKEFHSTPVTTLDVHEQTGALVTGAEDGSVCLTNPDGKFLSFGPPHRGLVHNARFHRNAFCSASADGVIRVWDFGVKDVRCEFQHGSLALDHDYEEDQWAVVHAQWLGDLPFILSAGLDCTARLWNVASTKCSRILTGHTGPILEMSWTLLGADWVRVATVSDDCSLRIHDVCLL